MTAACPLGKRSSVVWTRKLGSLSLDAIQSRYLLPRVQTHVRLQNSLTGQCYQKSKNISHLRSCPITYPLIHVEHLAERLIRGMSRKALFAFSTAQWIWLGRDGCF